MASSAPPSDATDSPVLSLINELEKLLPQLSLAAQRLPHADESTHGGDQTRSMKRSAKKRLICEYYGKKTGASSSHRMATSSGYKKRRICEYYGKETGASCSHRMATSSGYDQVRPMKRSAKRRRICEYYGTTTGASCSHGYGYEVFLSFRGPETRSSFVDFLYTRLKGAGIRTFKDDESIRVGEEFEPKLLEAISQSKISIPIFTKDYASSVWCLKEVAHMVRSGHHIKPIFYDVAPAVVRYQTDDYAEAFLKHKEKNRHGEETIEEWKEALKKVAAISGWDLHNETNRKEGEFAERVTREVSIELKKADLVVSDCLVRVDNHVNAIMEKIGAQTSETRIVGVHGMGGIGKTTIAKLVYNELSRDFQHCCFLSNIREMSERKGIEFLQGQLISSVLEDKFKPTRNVDEGIRTIEERLCTKKVLLLLDDVDDKKHMDALAGERNWFGKGSKLIITTKNKKVLEVLVKDSDFYEVDGMNDDQSLELFSKHAFKRNYPLPEYIDQSTRAIRIARGLPLALEVIGSLLGHTEKEMWDATLKMLESAPHNRVQSKLKISYDALDFRQKRIFLDIACLFIGHNKDILVHFWDESIFFPKEAMRVLQSMSLIKIKEDNEVWMHDQLRDLGREIVREKSDMKIEKQSRVWDTKEGLNLLRHKGKKEADALRLKLEQQPSCRFTYEVFENLSDLRFLEVIGSSENFHAETGLLQHENGNSDLLPYLRWLSWSDFPPAFNIANFFLEDVVILNLSESDITDDWKGWSHMKVMKMLKVLNLSNCRYFKRLPDELGRDFASLEYLYLHDCTSLKKLPDSMEDLESLVELDISWTHIKDLPDSIGKLKSLKKLKINVGHIGKIPDALWTIEKLEEIEVSKQCIDDHFRVNIGNCINKNQSLRILRLRSADINSLPSLPQSLVELELDELHMKMFPDLSNLTNLKGLGLLFKSHESYGESDGHVEECSIPKWMGNLSKLESLHLRCHFVTTSPTDLTLPPHLKKLFLRCDKLRGLPRLPSSLSSLELHCDSLRSMEDLSNLKKLSSLLIHYAEIKEIQGLGCLENLRDLDLVHLGQVKMLPNLRNLNRLRRVQIESCDNLVEIQGALPRFLDNLFISSCDSLQNLPDLSNSSELRCLEVHSCRDLVKIQGELPRSLEVLQIISCLKIQELPDLSSLKELQMVNINYCEGLMGEKIIDSAQRSQANLQICGLKHMKKLPDLSSLNKLSHLEVGSCANLDEIQGKLPQSLEVLNISSCPEIQELPDLSSLKKLQRVSIENCEELKGETIIGSARRSQANLWENLRYLRICGLKQMKKLPDLSNLNKLRHLEVGSCANLDEIQGKLPESLKVLEIYSCIKIKKLPDLSSLKELQKVSIENCKGLKGETIIGSARRSQANLWENLRYLRICGLKQMKKLPDLSNLNKLRHLEVGSCANLDEIQGKLPESLKVLEISSCIKIKKLPDLSSLKELQKVSIENCKGLKGETIIGSARRSQANLWENLRYLRICGLKQMKKLPDLSNLNKLRHLEVGSCANLDEIQGKLPESLKVLEISSCIKIKKLPDLSSLKELQKVSIKDCKGLKGETIIGSARRTQANFWENLLYLRIYGLNQMEKLPDLSNLNKLRHLGVGSCANLDEIQGKLPESLEVLKIFSCPKIQELPDLSSLNRLRTVKIYDCDILNTKDISSLCLEKSVKFVEDESESEFEFDYVYEFESESESESEGGLGGETESESESEYEGEDEE